MPNQNVSKKTQSILSHYETINENLRCIDSLSTLIIGADGVYDGGDMVPDCMQVISRLAVEARDANDAICKIVKGGANG